MVITINGRDYELNFGLQFLKLVGKEYGLSLELEGMDLPLNIKGANIMVVNLEQKDFLTTYNVIRFALATSKIQPSSNDVEKFLEELMVGSTLEDDKFGDFVGELLDNIKKVPAVAYELMQ